MTIKADNQMAKCGGKNYDRICFKFDDTQLKDSKEHTATKLSPDRINKETEK